MNKISGFYGILSLITGHPIDFSQWLFYSSSILILPFYVNGLQNVKKPDLPKFSLISLVFCADTVASIFFILFFSHQWFGNNDTESSTNASPAASTAASIAAVAVATAFTPATAATGTAITATRTAITAATTAATTAANTAVTTVAAAAATAAHDYVLEDPSAVATNLYKRTVDIYLRDTDAAKLASQSASKTYEFLTILFTCIIVVVIRIYFSLVLLSFTRQILKSSKYGVNSDDFHQRNNLTNTNQGKFKTWLHRLENKSVDILIKIFDE